ncbi:DUF2061 domain-containing protein [Vicingus serpentipes]|uniref:DUF2061 domain-containing protein n=1 Tax=Vicingus serpentipes TaxID=1926625 RepID=A0A5C6RSQ1_9FLAO|nr:DUF2061 domain-containing protein [Vicingus serpentipes]TXB64670.1 DUF2061 domain-containing protein [Vicingus serpentipes]
MSEDFLIKRHLAKTMTWRIVGTIDTMIIGWIVSGDPLVGLSIGGTEVLTKMVLYFLHERAWFKYGYSKKTHGAKMSRKRHLLKTISWRVIGTIDTMLLAWLISGNPLIGLKVGGIEVITKMILYYFHERVWYKYDFGIEKEKNNG